jgi:hypothetical protein
MQYWIHQRSLSIVKFTLVDQSLLHELKEQRSQLLKNVTMKITLKIIPVKYLPSSLIR